jgi:predicted SnoaL-like aldol condensation-catalyzing enzyme
VIGLPTTANPLQVFTRIIEEAFNTGDVAVLDDLVAPHFVEHQFAPPNRPAPAVGPAGVAAIVREIRRGADDFHLAIEDSVVVGDTVWVRLTGTGTDTGGQLGRPPSGRPFTITVIDIARFERGRMVEHWGMPDRLGVLLQTGALSGA